MRPHSLIFASLVLALGLGASTPARADSGQSMAGGGTTAPAAPPKPAPQPATAPQPQAPPQDPNTVAPIPGQVDFYERANENLALQALYTNNRIELLKAVLDQYIEIDPKSKTTPDAQGVVKKVYILKDGLTSLPPEGRQQILHESQGYCSDDQDDVALVQCASGLITLQAEQLEQVRNSVVSTQDAAGRLRSETLDAAGGVSGSKVPVANGVLPQGKKIRALAPPHVPTYMELNSRAADSAPSSPWVVEMGTHRPNKADYLATKPVLMNPEEQGDKNTIDMIQRDPKGAALLDQRKYQEALRRDPLRKSKDGLAPEDIKREALVAQKKALDPTLRKNLDTTDLMKAAYRAARVQLVDTFNKDRKPADAQKQKNGNLDIPNSPKKSGSSRSDADADKAQVKDLGWNKDGTLNEAKSLYIDPGEIEKMIDDAMDSL